MGWVGAGRTGARRGGWIGAGGVGAWDGGGWIGVRRGGAGELGRPGRGGHPGVGRGGAGWLGRGGRLGWIGVGWGGVGAWGGGGRGGAGGGGAGPVGVDKAGGVGRGGAGGGASFVPPPPPPPPQSFSDLEDWWGRVQQKIEDGDFEGASPAFYLLGNKIDLAPQRQVSEKSHARWIAEKELGGGFFVSARSGENVLKVFVSVAAKSMGVVMTDYDLGFLDKVLEAEAAVGGEDEGRTDIADRIEAEDRAMEEAKRRRAEAGGCACCVS